jgi:sugar/nucleoside kinase (ribokinase family)
MPKKNHAKPYGLVGAGNALVDVLAHVDDDFIAAQARKGMKKGGMTLIDTARARELYAAMNVQTEMSGGSVANSVSCFASFGGPGAFIGKVGDDALGRTFRTDMQSQGIAHNTPAFVGPEETGRCYIMITPDGERTMNTYLGTNAHFGPRDIDADKVKGASFALLEGYLFDKPSAKRAFEKVAAIGKKYDTKIAMTFSDAGCVARHYDDFKRMVRNNVDVLFASEGEIKAYAMTDDFEVAARVAAADVHTAILTRGGKGAVILTNGKRYDIPAMRPKKFVDTTGAGDAFAGGVLYGLWRGFTPDKCGRLGALAATETIGHTGARSPDLRFKDLLPKL